MGGNPAPEDDNDALLDRPSALSLARACTKLSNDAFCATPTVDALGGAPWMLAMLLWLLGCDEGRIEGGSTAGPCWVLISFNCSTAMSAVGMLLPSFVPPSAPRKYERRWSVDGIGIKCRM